MVIFATKLFYIKLSIVGKITERSQICSIRAIVQLKGYNRAKFHACRLFTNEIRVKTSR